MYTYKKSFVDYALYIVLALVVICGLGMFLGNLITVEKNVIVDQKWWETTAKRTETDTDYVCKPGMDGDLECGWETTTRTLCRATKTGLETEEITFPTLNCTGGDYSQYVFYYLEYHVEETTKKKVSGVNAETWYRVEHNNTIAVKVNLFGDIKRIIGE